MKKMSKNAVIIYQSKSGGIDLKGDFKKETIWATQAQMAAIFDVNPQAVTKHLQSVYQEKELSKKATCSKMEQVRKEGSRTVKRSLEIYNLDVIISIGYRINSLAGTKFRQWATKTIREHITQGYTLNKKRVAQNLDQFLKAVNEVKLLLPGDQSVDMRSVLSLVTTFAKTWLSLEAYDSAKLPKSGLSKEEVIFTAEELTEAIHILRKDLMSKKDATELFANERTHHGLHGIVGNVLQSFGGEDLYPTVEEKAVHLLYFMVKDHPFTDGNKRSGAFAFVWYLQKSGLLNPLHITPETLTALTLLIAESPANEKDRMVGLVLLLLRK
ncbi:death-on-curing protein [Candidatus Peregrinibacteria bacterium RIFCSPLOWO2_02_FULL_48_14]|nr:MAG: death-on-curing protein [Candidatus Peregrinibacteria bacterium RIFCSPLOWO2_01_FULL_48_20]OGJ43938.1 MAG: death-on-curing protein [Candidatus Peregrinibacteria bacterium RIFCSPLOWO2_02_FULL_48_14]